MTHGDSPYADAVLAALLAGDSPNKHPLPVWSPNPDDRPASVLIPLLRTPTELRVLLTRRSDDLSKHAGEYSFPGGRPDPGDESALHTALREAEEEVGLKPEFVRVLGTLPATSTYRTNYAITPFVGVIDDRRSWVSQESEVAELAEPLLVDLLAAREVHHFDYQGAPFAMPAFPLGPERVVWGATARILDELLHRLAPVLTPAGAQDRSEASPG